ncbi:deaminase domain-containing protein [Clostridium tetani]|uniref:deaminase domain-containing protein n=1 Tax=Clostridium tetani TaxID=1513 RepID=UPI0038B249D5
MNKYYKELIKMMAKNEKEVDKLLRLNYSKALSDIKKTILEYTMRYEKLSYSEWLQYNRLKSLEQQINIDLNNMYEKNYKVINDNSFKSYEENYFGLFYELEQNLKLNLSFTMLNEEYVSKAVEYPVDGLKLSERLYGRNLNNLKLKTKGALIDGIINDRGYKKLAIDISNIGVADYKQSLRIAITEGGRLKSLAREDSYQEAKRLGIDLKKRWLSTLDHKTRDSHRALDGVTIGIDEEFEIRGYKALQPRLFGVASEDIHCRCDTITVVEGIAPELRRDNVSNEVIEYKNYNEWYQNKVEKYGEEKVKILDKMERDKSSDKRQHERYKRELGKLVPNIFESFQNIKYNNVERWNELKDKFKIVSSYKVDYGEVSPEKIFELHKLAFETKRNKFTGKYKKEGNIAVVQYDNTIKYAHSKIQKSTNKGYEKFKGDKNELILLKDKESRVFKTKVVDGYDRFLDTEAKIFEYLDSKAKGVKEITLLSEKDMCESCRGVAKQFIDKYKNVKVNVASGKKDVHWEDK